MDSFQFQISATGQAVDTKAAREIFDKACADIKALGAERITGSGSFTSSPEQHGAANVTI
jgi:hypothetical protein